LRATFHDLVRAADNLSTTHALILDFKKAFDKAPHLLLIEKIRRIKGVDPVIANWIQSFLTDKSKKW